MLVDPALGVFAVADGMGGHTGGAQASSIAVQTLHEEVSRNKPREVPAPAGPGDVAATCLIGATRAAGRQIYETAVREPELVGMGTTVTCAMFLGSRIYIGHVGDSRAYLFREHTVAQLTEDHTWIEEQVQAGYMSRDEAERSELKHIVTRSVGYEADVNVDMLVLPVMAGDCYLLCSDGLSNHLHADELRDMVLANYYADLPQALIDEANRRGGDDNVTVVAVYVANDDSESCEDGEGRSADT